LLANNSCAANYVDGIYLYYSNGNRISYNTLFNNKRYGVYISQYSIYSIIHHNNFIDNHGSNLTFNSTHIQALANTTADYWNDTYGNGNYWSDWKSPDNDSNGIVDEPYILDGTAGAKDFFPLVHPVALVPDPSPLPFVMLTIVLFAGVITHIRRKN
jgi:parallel beta-helix repeat protein